MPLGPMGGGNLAPNVAPTVNLTPVGQQHAGPPPGAPNGDLYGHTAGPGRGPGGMGGAPGRGAMGGMGGAPGRGGGMGGRGMQGGPPGGMMGGPPGGPAGGRGGPMGAPGRGGGRGPAPAPAPAPPVPDEDYNFEEVRRISGYFVEEVCILLWSVCVVSSGDCVRRTRGSKLQYDKGRLQQSELCTGLNLQRTWHARAACSAVSFLLELHSCMHACDLSPFACAGQQALQQGGSAA
jgi:hypothetical protein